MGKSTGGIATRFLRPRFGADGAFRRRPASCDRQLRAGLESGQPSIVQSHGTVASATSPPEHESKRPTPIFHPGAPSRSSGRAGTNPNLLSAHGFGSTGFGRPKP